MRPHSRHRRTGVAIVTTAAMLAVATPAVAFAAPSPGDDEPQPRNLQGKPSDYILDIEESLVDLEAGTRETRIDKPDKQTKKPVEEITVTLDASVFFDTDQHTLRPGAQATLRDVANQIRGHGGTTVDIGGHTDSRGSDAYNQALSERRANTVRQFLATALRDAKLTATGFGESQPIAPNETENGDPYAEGMALNRRVEITYTATR